MSIKKKLKKEESRRKINIAVSIAIGVLMPYVVYILKSEGIFTEWEIYFANFYTVFVVLLVIINIIRNLSDNKFDFIIKDQKIKIKDSIFSSPITINLNKIVYIDVSERPQGDFEILIITDKLKKSRGFFEFDSSFVKMKSAYKDAYRYLCDAYPDKKFYFIMIKKGGCKKYKMLYMLYKNCYNGKFSSKAIEYIKTFIEEYNLG